MSFLEDLPNAIDFSKYIHENGFVLYGERIGVLRDKANEYAGSLVLPDQAQMRPKRGTVVLRGLGIDDESGLAGMEIGDRVLFSTYRTVVITLPDRDGTLREIDIFHATDIYVGWRVTKENQDIELGID